ncbi:MAG TPA: carboxymuconolactone decarboxylase family protein, partial [Bauldia sp.]|nr:carboxymuconolactone decarboxylase family protein [Bauldia sp.]
MRISDIDEASLTPDQQRVFAAIKAGPRGVVVGPLRVWLHSPRLAEKAQELGAFCRYGTSLPPVLSELAILVTGAHWRAGFEWHAHAPIAIKAGLSADVVDAIRRDEEPSFTNAAEGAVYAFCRRLLTMRTMDQATYDQARQAIGETGLVDLVGILGYYALISMTIVGFEVPTPDG